MKRSQLQLLALLSSMATGCGSEVTVDDVYTLRAAIGAPEGLNIDDRRVLALSNAVAADVADLALRNGYAYSLSGLAVGDRLCPREGDFGAAEDIPIGAPCDQDERSFFLGGNSPDSARQASEPQGLIFERSKDGQRFRLLILDHGVEATDDGGRAFVTFELARAD